MSRPSRRALLGAAAALLTAACRDAAPSSPPGPASPPTAAPGELTPPAPTAVRPGTVVAEAPAASLDGLAIYTPLGQSLAGGVATGIERARPGVAVRVVALPSGDDVVARVRAERAAPRADVFLGGASDLHEALARDGLLEPHRSPAVEAVPAPFRAVSGAWVGFYLGVLGTLVHRERYGREAGGADPPEGWDDLLKPAFKGRIALPDPARTRAGYLFLSGQVGRLGDETKALAFMRRLHENGASYPTTEPAALEAIGKGPALIAIGWHHDALDAQDRGEPLGFTAPPAPLVEVGAVSLIKGGPNPTAAGGLVDFLLGRDGAQLVVGVGNRPSTVAGAPSPAGLAPVEGAALAPLDRAWAADNRARLVRAWQDALGR